MYYMDGEAWSLVMYYKFLLVNQRTIMSIFLLPDYINPFVKEIREL